MVFDFVKLILSVALSDLVGQVFKACFKPLQSQVRLGIFGELVSWRQGGDKETVCSFEAAALSMLLHTWFPSTAPLSDPAGCCLTASACSLGSEDQSTLLPATVTWYWELLTSQKLKVHI